MKIEEENFFSLADQQAMEPKETDVNLLVVRCVIFFLRLCPMSANNVISHYDTNLKTKKGSTEFVSTVDTHAPSVEFFRRSLKAASKFFGFLWPVSLTSPMATRALREDIFL